MSDLAEGIRALLRTNEEQLRVQALELLASLGDGALYAEILDGWAWDSRGYRLVWQGSGDEPMRYGQAEAVWKEAPIDAPFPPALALDKAASVTLWWGRSGAEERVCGGLMRKMLRMKRLRHAWVILREGSPPFSFEALPRRLRSLVVRCEKRRDVEDLAGIAAMRGLTRLSLLECRFPAGPLPLPPGLANLMMFEGSREIDLDAALGPVVPRHVGLTGVGISGSLARLQAIRALYLRNIPAIPAGLETLRDLTVLELEGSDLESVPPEVFRLPRLRWLSLEENLLKRLPSDLARLAGLRRLTLHENPLPRLPPVLTRLRELRRLDLRRLDLRRFPPWLPQLRKLEILDIYACPLEDPGIDLLLRLPRLRLLNVSDDLRGAAQEVAERAAKEQGRRIVVR